MPESKSRHPQTPIPHHVKPPVAHAKHKKTNQSIIVAVIFFAFIGLGISYFIGNSSVAALIIGTLIGGVAGYIFGKQVNKSLMK